MRSADKCPGLLSELAFFHQATLRGFHVFTPLYHESPADCIVYLPPHGPVRVQVKTMCIRSDRTQKRWTNTKVYRGRGHRKKRYKHGDADLFAFRCGPDWHFILFSEAISKTRISVQKPNNNWSLFHADYRVFYKPD